VEGDQRGGRSATEPLMTRFAAALLVAVALSGSVVLGGCGSDSDTGATSGSAPSGPVPATARGGKGEREAPKGASATLREIYRQFPPPNPNPAVRGSAKAIAVGRRACKGKTPLEVREAFYPLAVEKGTIAEDSPQAEMIADIDDYEKRGSQDPSFVAGQLAAGTYQATLPEARAQFGYQGCIYSLALRLKQELAPRRSR